MVKSYPSIADQIGAMREVWPTLHVVGRDEREAMWEGCVVPILREYRIQIRYRVPPVIELIAPLRQQPLVRILEPRLKRRSGDREGALPHVYWDNPAWPALCLFDPDSAEWTPMSLLARTTVPWTLDWLACYEGWRATGRWSGGGRHAAILPGGLPS